MNFDERVRRLLQASQEQQAAIDRILEGETERQQSPGPLVLTNKAAAEYLGVSRSSIQRLIRTGSIPTVNIMPGTRRIRRSDLTKYVAKGYAIRKGNINEVKK